MGQRGRPRKDANAQTIPVATLACPICKKILSENEFYNSRSLFFDGKITYCKSCVDILYKKYVKKYKDDGHDFPEKDAIRRICMALDIYYSEGIFNTAVKNTESKPNMSLISSYFKIVQLVQYSRKTYDDTIAEEGTIVIESAEAENPINISKKTIKFFGTGFSDEDYLFLKEQYDDWTARHECNTKVQEEIFKQICFTQLELLKATRAKLDTKDLMATFQKLLESAKLQPKQNHSDSTSDAQTFGTLLDKWENTRPAPEIDEELKDVDRIGWYIETFFKGHLAKMMGIKNAFSKLYSDFMKKYSVKKPEYDSDENNSEVLFDAIFGNQDTGGD